MFNFYLAAMLLLGIVIGYTYGHIELTGDLAKQYKLRSQYLALLSKLYHDRDFRVHVNDEMIAEVKAAIFMPGDVLTHV